MVEAGLVDPNAVAVGLLYFLLVRFVTLPYFRFRSFFTIFLILYTLKGVSDVSQLHETWKTKSFVFLGREGFLVYDSESYLGVNEFEIFGGESSTGTSVFDLKIEKDLDKVFWVGQVDHIHEEVSC